MSVWNREELLAYIAELKAAYRAAFTGKSYTIGSRTLTRHDLSAIRAELNALEKELASLGQPRGIKRVQLRVVRP